MKKIILIISMFCISLPALAGDVKLVCKFVTKSGSPQTFTVVFNQKNNTVGGKAAHVTDDVVIFENERFAETYVINRLSGELQISPSSAFVHEETIIGNCGPYQKAF